jgi:hypothetical protein
VVNISSFVEKNGAEKWGTWAYVIKFSVSCNVDIKNEHVNVCMSGNRNACLHPPLKLEISHVQSSSALLYVVSATSAVGFVEKSGAEKWGTWAYVIKFSGEWW